MTKIGIYTYFPPYIGGGERYIMTFANALQDDHEVTFLCPDTIAYKNLAQILNIELSKVTFLEFHGISNYKIHVLKLLSGKYKPEYDVFIAMSNHSFPPVMGLGEKNVIHIQFPYPYPKRDLLNVKRAIQRWFDSKSYSLSIVNSEFTKKHVVKKSKYHVQVIYPPVEIDRFPYNSYQNKKDQILSVGRFIGTEDSKCQLEMVRLFKKMCDMNPTLDINYVCVGGVRPERVHQDYIRSIKEEAEGYPVTILTDISITNIANLYSDSKFFWHAKGYLSKARNPQYTEHFGISTVEAMSAGCVPLVYGDGGQLEIVEDGVSGYNWKSGDDLIDKTINLIYDYKTAKELSSNASHASKKFSSDRFKAEVKDIIKNIIYKHK